MAVAAWVLGRAGHAGAATRARPGRVRASRRAGDRHRAAALVRRRRCAASTGCRTASTTPRCATCAPASRPCSCRAACSSSLGCSPRRPRTPTASAPSTRGRPADRRAARARGRGGDHGRRATAAGCAPVLALSVLGFALAAVYAVIGAPDVALVAVLVETILTLVFVGVFARLPATRRQDAPSRSCAAAGGATRRAGVIAGRQRVRDDLGRAVATGRGRERRRRADPAARRRPTAATS